MQRAAAWAGQIAGQERVTVLHELTPSNLRQQCWTSNSHFIEFYVA
jgi:hypothetical protein